MSKDKQNKFGDYLRGLRERSELTAKNVEEKILELYPNEKAYHISPSYLNSIERGEKPPPHPFKIKALSDLYGESYEFMLYNAGYLQKNPFKNPKQWNKDSVRDLYLEQFSQTQKIRSLTQTEKKAVDKFVSQLITTFLLR